MESGSGKSTLGKFLSGLLPHSAKIGKGEYLIEEREVFAQGGFIEINKLRGREFRMQWRR